VRATLRELATMLSQQPGTPADEFALEAPAVKTAPAAAAKAAPRKASKKK
jgi:hypothetical protein